MSDIFDVLADATRRELLATLLNARINAMPRGELSVGELVERLELSQPTVSKHLQKLREHGLVSVRTNGQHHYYRLETAPLRDLKVWVDDFLATEEIADIATSPSFAAWSGADVGETLGRRLAEGTHQARVVVSEKVVPKLPKLRKGKGDSEAVDSE
jgi:ArsR family transcriptional regulator, arsenate/arsenite/antimonite-responsive transcriptional repressor